MDTIRRQARRSVQSLTRQDREVSTGLLFNMVRAGEIMPRWWSKDRDKQLRDMAVSSDHFQGASFMIAAKLANVPFKIQPRDRSIKRHQKLADQYQVICENVIQFGAGWQSFWTRFFADLWSTDNGAFAEVIGGGRPGGPLKGPAQGLAHLDSAQCVRKSNPEWPVEYIDTDGKRYKFHHTRVVFTSQFPSAIARMSGVGHCWLSRCLNNVQQLIDGDVYYQEALGSRPMRQMLLGRGISANEIIDSIRLAEASMDNQGLSRYSKTAVLGDPSRVDIGVDTIPFTFLPDGYNKEQQTTIGMSVIAVAGGFPPRWLWPATTTGATVADAAFSHISGVGGGAKQHLNMMRDLLSYSETSGTVPGMLPPKFIPKELKLVFDFQDDQQDAQQADIQDKRAGTRKTDIDTGVVTVRVAREQALADGDLTPAQFAQMELADGNLPDGDSVLTLFDSNDSLLIEMLDLGVEEPLAVDVNDPIEMMIAIEASALAAQARMVQARSAAEKGKARQAIEALGQLKDIYTEMVVREIEEQVAAEQAAGTFELPEAQAAPTGEGEAPQEAETKAFNPGAKLGERIRGGLFRGRGGKFASEADVSAIKSEILGRLIAKLRAARTGTGKGGAAKKPKKAGGGGGGAKPKKTPEQLARAKRAKQQATLNEVFGVGGNLAAKMEMERNDVFALEKAVLDGAEIDKDEAVKFAQLGLMKFDSDGEPFVTAAGRSVILNSARGDVGGATAALARGKAQSERVQVRADKKRQQAEKASKRAADLQEDVEDANSDADELGDEADELLAQASAEQDEKKADKLRDKAEKLQERAEKKRERATDLQERADEQVERATALENEAAVMDASIGIGSLPEDEQGQDEPRQAEPGQAEPEPVAPGQQDKPTTPATLKRATTQADFDLLNEVTAGRAADIKPDDLARLVEVGLFVVDAAGKPKLTEAGKVAIKATTEPPRGDFEQEIDDALVPVFKEAQVKTLAALQRGVPPDDDKLRQELNSLFIPILTDAALFKFGLFEDQFSLEFDAGETQAEAEAWARQHAALLTAGLVTTTQKIVNGIEPDATQEEIETTVDRAFNENRREQIGITETTVALMFGALLYQRFAASVNVKIELRWFTREDELVCPICRPLNRKPQAVWSQQFPGGAPAHVRCRCDVIAVKKRQ